MYSERSSPIRGAFKDNDDASTISSSTYSLFRGRGPVRSKPASSPKKKNRSPTKVGSYTGSIEEIKSFKTGVNGVEYKYTFDLSPEEETIKAFCDFHAEEATYQSFMTALVTKLESVMQRDSDASGPLKYVVCSLKGLVETSNLWCKEINNPESIRTFVAKPMPNPHQFSLSKIFEMLTMAYNNYLDKFDGCCRIIDEFPRTNVNTRLDLRNAVQELRRPLERVIDYRVLLRRLAKAKLSSDPLYTDVTEAFQLVHHLMKKICRILGADDSFQRVAEFEDSLIKDKCSPLESKPCRHANKRSIHFTPCPDIVAQTVFRDIHFTAKDGIKFSEKDMNFKVTKKRGSVTLTLFTDTLVITRSTPDANHVLLYPPVPLDLVDIEDKDHKGLEDLMEVRLSRTELLVLQPEGEKKIRFLEKFRAEKKRSITVKRSGLDSIRTSIDGGASDITQSPVRSKGTNDIKLEIDELILSSDGVEPRRLGWSDDDILGSPVVLFKTLCRPNKYILGQGWDKMAKCHFVVYCNMSTSWISLEMDVTAVSILQAPIIPSLKWTLKQEKYVDLACVNQHGQACRYLIQLKCKEDASSLCSNLKTETEKTTARFITKLRKSKSLWNAENASPATFQNTQPICTLTVSEGLVCCKDVWSSLGPLHLYIVAANVTDKEAYALGKIVGVSTHYPVELVMHGSLEENTFRYEEEKGFIRLSFGTPSDDTLFEYKLYHHTCCTPFIQGLQKELEKASQVKQLIIQREQELIAAREQEMNDTRSPDDMEDVNAYFNTLQIEETPTDAMETKIADTVMQDSKMDLTDMLDDSEPDPTDIPLDVLDNLYDRIKKEGLSAEVYPIFNSLFGILRHSTAPLWDAFSEESTGMKRSATDTTLSSIVSHGTTDEAVRGIRSLHSGAVVRKWNVLEAKTENLKKLSKLEHIFTEYRQLVDKTANMKGAVSKRHLNWINN